MFSEFPLNTNATVAILEQIGLSVQAREIVRLSFRTRIKQTPEMMISVQFRLDQREVTERQKGMCEEVQEEILHKLQKHYPEETFEVVIQISMCCGSDCLGCRKFIG